MANRPSGKTGRLSIDRIHINRMLLTEMAQRLEDNRARLQEAAELGLVTELERVAAVSRQKWGRYSLARP